jgi:hypothetical protein
MPFKTERGRKVEIETSVKKTISKGGRETVKELVVNGFLNMAPYFCIPTSFLHMNHRAATTFLSPLLQASSSSFHTAMKLTCTMLAAMSYSPRQRRASAGTRLPGPYQSIRTRDAPGRAASLVWIRTSLRW